MQRLKHQHERQKSGDSVQWVHEPGCREGPTGAKQADVDEHLVRVEQPGVTKALAASQSEDSSEQRRLHREHDEERPHDRASGKVEHRPETVLAGEHRQDESTRGEGDHPGRDVEELNEPLTSVPDPFREKSNARGCDQKRRWQ